MKQLDSHIEFVFGGTFDPVHFGHIAIVQALVKLAPQILIRLIPCALPALKSKPATSFEHRVNMLKLAAKDFENTLIDERENDRNGASYTVDTLGSLRNEFDKRVFILVMGADTAGKLTRWHDWQKLTSLCHIAVLNRAGNSLKEIETEIAKSGFMLHKKFLELTQKSSGLAFMLEMPEKQQSSSQIRHSFRQYCENNLELDSMLPQSVIKYVVKHRLY